MDDQIFEAALQRLSKADCTARSGPEFCDGVWQRVGAMGEARDRRRRTVLSTAIFLLALGAGMGITQGSVSAKVSGYSLLDGTDLAPSSLLHVAP